MFKDSEKSFTHSKKNLIINRYSSYYVSAGWLAFAFTT